MISKSRPSIGRGAGPEIACSNLRQPTHRGSLAQQGVRYGRNRIGRLMRQEGSIIVPTPHEKQDCFTVTSILRNLPQVPEFVVSWEYPLMRVTACVCRD